MKELFKEIKQFQDEYFPTSNALSKAKHLKKEIKELVEELENHKGGNGEVENTKMEYADCFLLLIGSCQAYGMSYEDVIETIKEKIEINKNRKWAAPNEDGVVLHIKD